MKILPKPEKEVVPPEREPSPTPGTCQCGHWRCCHDDAKGSCRVAYPPSEKWKDGSVCACKCYIFDPDADDDDDEDEEPEPISPEELEKLYSR